MLHAACCNATITEGKEQDQKEDTIKITKQAAKKQLIADSAA